MVIFAYPALMPPIETITIRNPELDDRHSVTNNLITHISRGKTIRTILSTSPRARATVVTNMRFVLRPYEGVALYNFLKRSEGHFLHYVDYNGVSWYCILNMDTLSMQTNKRNITTIDLVLSRWPLVVEGES